MAIDFSALGSMLSGAGGILGPLLNIGPGQETRHLAKSMYKQDVLSSWGQLLQDANIANMNLQAQYDVLDWQKQAQETAWNREDSAVQRRVADLKAAGLNPVLAAGSAASSSGPISIKAPQAEGVKWNSPTGRLQAVMDATANYGQTLAGTMAAISQARSLNARADVDEAVASHAKSNALEEMLYRQNRNRKIESDTNLSKAKGAYEWQDVEYYKRYGTPPAGGQSLMRDVKEGLQWLRSDEVKDELLNNKSSLNSKYNEFMDSWEGKEDREPVGGNW